MRYISTRDRNHSLTSAQAILQGLAPDGGLYLMDAMPDPINPASLRNASYQSIADAILRLFLPDYPEQAIRRCVSEAYDDKFNDPAIAPLRPFDGGSLLELWHGPTSAFKDLALTILPRLLSSAYEQNHLEDTISILTATSGDTGKAALAGFADVPHTAVTVFYPEIGVSPIQKLQMQTAAGRNVSVIALQGNFDDCQRLVKAAAGDPGVRSACRHVRISSANSINIGRLIPQIVYYFSAYLDLVRSGTVQCGEPVSFIVPTGNFGDILAGYLAREIGLPVQHLVCASNANHVLTDFLETGTYSTHRSFQPTISPSMDILVSSNLERLLYLASGRDEELIRSLMGALSDSGSYTVPASMLERIRQVFRGCWADEAETMKEIHDFHEESGLLIDPHTAVAMHAFRSYRREFPEIPCVVLSTASPYKFPRAVLSAVQGKPADMDDFEAMRQLSALSGMPVPQGLAELPGLPVRFRRVIRLEEGLSAIAERMEELSHD